MREGYFVSKQNPVRGKRYEPARDGPGPNFPSAEKCAAWVLECYYCWGNKVSEYQLLDRATWPQDLM